MKSLMQVKFILIFSSVFIMGLSAHAPSVFSATVSQSALISETNEARSIAGLSPYRESLSLTLAALRKGLLMYHTGVFAHSALDGRTPWDLVAETGYSFQTVGENLGFAYGDTETLINAMLNSPAHRANLLSSNHTELGVAVVPHPTRTGQMMVVMIFASPAGQSLPI